MDHKDTRYAPWEKAFDRILSPFEPFVHDRTAGGILFASLIVSAAGYCWLTFFTGGKPTRAR